MRAQRQRPDAPRERLRAWSAPTRVLRKPRVTQNGSREMKRPDDSGIGEDLEVKHYFPPASLSRNISSRARCLLLQTIERSVPPTSPRACLLRESLGIYITPAASAPATMSRSIRKAVCEER